MSQLCVCRRGFQPRPADNLMSMFRRGCRSSDGWVLTQNVPREFHCAARKMTSRPRSGASRRVSVSAAGHFGFNTITGIVLIVSLLAKYNVYRISLPAFLVVLNGTCSFGWVLLAWLMPCRTSLLSWKYRENLPRAGTILASSKSWAKGFKPLTFTMARRSNRKTAIATTAYLITPCLQAACRQTV